MAHRVITPFSNAPSDEEVISASDVNPVVWEEFGGN